MVSVTMRSTSVYFGDVRTRCQFFLKVAQVKIEMQNECFDAFMLDCFAVGYLRNNLPNLNILGLRNKKHYAFFKVKTPPFELYLLTLHCVTSSILRAVL